MQREKPNLMVANFFVSSGCPGWKVEYRDISKIWIAVLYEYQSVSDGL